MSLLIYRKLGKLRRTQSFCFLFSLCGFGSLTSVVSTLGKSEGHLGEGKDEQDRDGVDHIEEDDLSKEELVTGCLFLSAGHSILTEVCVMCENIGHESVKGVNRSDVVELEEEDSTHSGGDKENEGSEPLDSVEDTYEEEGGVVDSVVLGESELFLAIAVIVVLKLFCLEVLLSLSVDRRNIAVEVLGYPLLLDGNVSFNDFIGEGQESHGV